MAAVAFYGLLWLAGANDVLAEKFHVSLFATTWFFRVAFFVGPFLAFVFTKRICLGLQRKDADIIGHGVESGVIMMSPDGKFSERHEAAREEEKVVILSRRTPGRRLRRATPPGSRRPAPRARSGTCARGSTAPGPSTTSRSRSTGTVTRSTRRSRAAPRRTRSGTENRSARARHRTGGGGPFRVPDGPYAGRTMTRTLIVTNDFPPRPGGIQAFVHGLAARRPPGSVVVYAPAWKGAAEFDAAQPFRSSGIRAR